MKRLFVALVALSTFATSLSAPTSALAGSNADSFTTQNLTIEPRDNPVGIESTTPRMSWKTEFQSSADQGNVYNKSQSAYQMFFRHT